MSIYNYVWLILEALLDTWEEENKKNLCNDPLIDEDKAKELIQ